MVGIWLSDNELILARKKLNVYKLKLWQIYLLLIYMVLNKRIL